MALDRILDDYDRVTPALKEQLPTIESKLLRLLGERAIKTHSVSSRIKSRDSLQVKVSRPDKTYAALWDVTDLVALRVTAYFEDTIEQVMELVERNFAVDFSHSVDRLESKDSRAFGYRSFHYVCAWDQQSNSLVPKEFRFEIQLRTILQHAWAEIEHDLGYKASDSTPDSIRRRFSRVAGLLELVDEEFVSIRSDLKSYELSVKDSLSDPFHSFPLDRVSLELSAATVTVVAVDSEIAAILGKPLGSQVFFPEYLLKMLKLSGFKNTYEMRKELEKSRAAILKVIPAYFDFARKAWKLSASDLDAVPRGYSLFFLSHIAVLRSPILELNKVTKLAQFYRELDYPDDEASAYQVASGLVEALKAAGLAGIFD